MTLRPRKEFLTPIDINLDEKAEDADQEFVTAWNDVEYFDALNCSLIFGCICTRSEFDNILLVCNSFTTKYYYQYYFAMRHFANGDLYPFKEEVFKYIDNVLNKNKFNNNYNNNNRKLTDLANKDKNLYCIEKLSNVLINQEYYEMFDENNNYQYSNLKKNYPKDTFTDHGIIYHNGVLPICSFIKKFNELNNKNTENIISNLWFRNKFNYQDECGILFTIEMFISFNQFREICYYIKDNLNNTDLWNFFVIFFERNTQNKQNKKNDVENKIDNVNTDAKINDYDHDMDDSLLYFNKIPFDWKPNLRKLIKKVNENIYQFKDDTEIDEFISNNKELKQYFRRFEDTKLSKLIWLIGNLFNHFNALKNYEKNSQLQKNKQNFFESMYILLQDGYFSFLPYLIDQSIVYLSDSTQDWKYNKHLLWIKNKLTILKGDLHFLYFFNKKLLKSKYAFGNILMPGLKHLSQLCDQGFFATT